MCTPFSRSRSIWVKKKIFASTTTPSNRHYFCEIFISRTLQHIFQRRAAPPTTSFRRQWREAVSFTMLSWWRGRIPLAPSLRHESLIPLPAPLPTPVPGGTDIGAISAHGCKFRAVLFETEMLPQRPEVGEEETSHSLPPQFPALKINLFQYFF